MERAIDIYKAGGIILKDKTFLVSRSGTKNIFIAPGGKLEPGESAEKALCRELMEELQISVTESDLVPFGTFYAQAAGQEDKYIRMDVFVVKAWKGEIAPAHEIKEIRWIDSQTSDIELGSIFQHDVLPKLKERGLIN